MKKLEIIIKPEKLEDLKEVLDTEEVNGLNIVNIMGYGNQKGIVKKYRGAEYRRTRISRNHGQIDGGIAPVGQCIKGEKVDMSIRYKLASAALRAAGTKKLFALPEEELLEKVRGMNRRRQFQMPKDHKAVYGDRLILGQYHCLTIQLGQKSIRVRLVRVAVSRYSGLMRKGYCLYRSLDYC